MLPTPPWKSGPSGPRKMAWSNCPLGLVIVRDGLHYPMTQTPDWKTQGVKVVRAAEMDTNTALDKF
jgi:hypothetical protein